jgi:hypothetical protein
LAVVGAPTLQSTKHKQKKLSHTQHTHDEPLPPYPKWLCPPSPWVGQLCPKIGAPPLPIAMWRPRAIGVVLAVVGLLVWGVLVTAINIYRERGALALNNNQTEDGFDVGRGFGEGARQGRNVWGGQLPFVWGG